MISMELSTNKNLAYKIFRGIPYSRLTLLDAEQRRETNDVCPEELGLNDAGIYTSESSEAIRHLRTNVELLDSKSLFMHSLVALVVTKLLEQSGRFFISAEGNEPMTPSNEELIKTGALLLSNLLKIQINCYGVEHEMKRIGAGIYPTLSLVNHSCNPSAKHYTRGRNMILRAVRPIAAGEEVTISYTPDYLDEEREKRRKHLAEKYHIACECDACQFEWQTASKLPALMLKCFRCTQSVSGDLPVCYSCRLEYKNKSSFEDKIRFDTIAKQVDATFLSACKIAQNLMRAESISEEEYQSLCTATEFIHEHTAMPCQVIYNMERILEKYFTVER
ncbi:SET and MYND domain-containing protein 4-like [Macrobrachium nipponense]|uniref:SET and MYND domain-containing protein 4-like n=1 Tax=Macrobrachium nipponense TaxID=159736 RepID=UPI0030C81DF9